MQAIVAFFQKVAEAPTFHNFITAVIIFAGILVGMETYPSIMAAHGSLLHVFDKIVLAIFVLEIIVKMGAEYPRPLRYFRDPWNVFDFVIVAICFVPGMGEYAVILRLARLLRVLKLVHALPRLQMLVNALLKSIPSMIYVTLLLLLLFYVYAVAAVFLFGENDPVHFRNLQLSMLSLFRTVTLEDWTDLMYIQIYGCDAYGYEGMKHLCTTPRAWPLVSPVFFVSFVLAGTMVILNLFIGVIMKSMEEAALEYELAEELKRQEKLGSAAPSAEHELYALNKQLQEMQTTIARIQSKLSTRGLDPMPRGTDGEAGGEESPG